MLTAGQIEEFRQNWRPTQEKVDCAVKAAIEIAAPSRVFVFGSWARGEATPQSDLDLAVLVPMERRNEIPELHRRIHRKLEEIPMSVDLVIVPEDRPNAIETVRFIREHVTARIAVLSNTP